MLSLPWGERSRLTGVSVKSDGSPEDELMSKSPLGSCLNRREDGPLIAWDKLIELVFAHTNVYTNTRFYFCLRFFKVSSMLSM